VLVLVVRVVPSLGRRRWQVRIAGPDPATVVVVDGGGSVRVPGGHRGLATLDGCHASGGAGADVMATFETAVYAKQHRYVPHAM
jgi:hypothetical protein